MSMAPWLKSFTTTKPSLIALPQPNCIERNVQIDSSDSKQPDTEMIARVLCSVCSEDRYLTRIQQCPG
ncbi:hypothetical protein AMELA_G00038560 [Ameiurus melas]|uniref:Uncharacterized protein n=1 Tax=Ameiurus melas TaxID=219545 RepID=A0A7J6B931_AMEME|nr:hypothetical protein AMELA_G00038560 [Ameiurus melas]